MEGHFQTRFKVVITVTIVTSVKYFKGKPEVGDHTGEQHPLDGVVGHRHLHQGRWVCEKVFTWM